MKKYISLAVAILVGFVSSHSHSENHYQLHPQEK